MTILAEQLLARQEARRLSATSTASVDVVAANPAKRTAEKLSITQAALQTGLSRDTLYRIYKAGFVTGSMPGPKKIVLDAASLRDYLDAAAQPGFWTAERRALYRGKVVTP